MIDVGTNSGRPESDHVRQVVRSAEEELRQLLRQRAELMKRIGTIKQTLAGLANIFGKAVLSEELRALVNGKSITRQSGFTRACRLVLMGSASPLSARQVCEQLQRKAPEILERHRSPVASVTTVLGRLVDYAEACTSLDPGGQRLWTWVADSDCSEESVSSRNRASFLLQSRIEKA
jgi:chorismate mutase